MSGTSSKRDKPWLFRTYAGHSTARPPTSFTGGTSPRVRPGSRSPSTCRPRPATTATTSLARGEVGKVGVPISHLGDMRSLFEGIPLDAMNTSMTINATAAWLLALYVALAEEQGADQRKAHRHGAERHSEGISLARDLHLPAGAVASADQGRDRLHQPRDAEMESDQCLLLSFAGGGSDAGAGACLRAGHSRGRAGRGAEVGRGFAEKIPARRRQHLASSSMPACASSPKSPRCAPSSICGTRSPRSATA